MSQFGQSIFSQKEALMDVETFKGMYLFGVDLRDGNGNELPDKIIEKFISTAISYIEVSLNCPIQPKEIEQYIDYDFGSYRKYSFIQTDIYPIRKVEEVAIAFNSPNVEDNIDEDRSLVKITFPKSWYRVYENAGQIQLLPDVSTLSAVIIAQAGQLLPRAISGPFAPQLMKVVATCGIADDDDCVPPIINQAIGLYASIYLLQMIGDIGPGGGAGLTSQSLSLDGMSQSVATAISATNNLYGATIAKYEKMLEKNVLPLLRKKYKRISTEFI